MIQGISIYNFQSHKKSELNFDSGVNVIIGKSDTGKSSIMHALQWAINNKPAGDSFRSYWGGDTNVDLEIENFTISREKGKENLYILSSNKGISPEEFKSFGQDVPKPIKDFLNFDEVNLQFQFDTPFLIFNTAGEVAKYLNQIVSLDVIDTSLSKIEADRKKINRDIAYTSSDIKEKEKQLKEYDFVDAAEKKLGQLENKSAELSKSQNKYSSIYDLIKKYEWAKKELSEFKEKQIDEKKIDSLLEKEEQSKSLEEKSENLEELIIKFETYKRKLKLIYDKINNLSQQENKLTKGIKICPLCNQPLKDVQNVEK